MDFILHADLIGSKQHLSSDGFWLDEIPEFGWVVGESVPGKDLLTALLLSGVKIEIKPPEVYAKIMNRFTHWDYIPWQQIMPDHVYEKWTTEALDKISKSLIEVDLSYYENIFIKASEVLDALIPMKIHGKKWNYLATHEIQGVSEDVIDSFEPYKNGFTDVIKYTQTSTVTGRLIVKSGPEILRLNKELKSMIKSRYKGGKVIQFDYVSLEPRLALLIAGHSVSEDVYSDINKLVFENKFTRDIVKISTLSIMYGAGGESLQEKVELSLEECKNIIKKLKEFFGIHDMSKKLSKEYRRDKIIRNYFNRALYSESGAGHRLFNNFIQSTAVDCAMMGFWNICQLWKGTKVLPLFLIHDNFGLDFPPELLTDENIEKTKMVGGEIPNLSGKLLLGHDMI